VVPAVGGAVGAVTVPTLVIGAVVVGGLISVATDSSTTGTTGTTGTN